MDYQQVHDYLMTKPEAQLMHPFGDEVNVYKVKNKMFATLSPAKASKEEEQANDDYWLNLKCDPDEAVMLREIFAAVIPGYHMNKRHWNTIILDGSIPQGELERMIDNSFKVVVEGMPRSEQQSLLMHL